MFVPHMLNSNLLSKSSCRPKQPSPLPSHPNQSSKTLLKPMPLVHATVNPRPNRSCVSRAATNSTASTSSHIRRRSGPQVWLQPLRDDEVFYLAYGSNMSPQVLSGRRRVRPHSSVPCYCPGYTLTFGVQGFPWAEPGFATIKAHRTPGGGQCHPPHPVESSSSWRRHVYECSTPCLHGVLHRVTQREWALIKASEGVLGSDKSRIGYQVIEVDCVLYDDTTVVKAATLQAAPASLHAEGRDVQPSARYLKLLQDGSKHHGLDSHYQQWLSSLQPYCPPGQVAATLGALTSGAVLMSAASTAVPAYVLSRALGSGSQQPVMSAGAGSEYGGELQAQPASSMATQGSCSSSGSRAGEDTQGSQAGAVPDGFVPFVRWYTGASQKLVWDVHDKLAPWLGSGSSRSS